jgi:sarcosine/dimethylglycine N-methyltransferase
MRQDERAPFVSALQRARVAAYAPGEFVDQESFMRATEIRGLAVAAGVAPGVSVLDLCCGVAGPGRFITRELGSRYVGVDSSASAIALARERAAGLDCRFEVGLVPPVPSGSYDVVLLLETMLAFADKDALVRDVSTALVPGGRFAFTLEEGEPLDDAERDAMPDADTVWLTPWAEILELLGRVCLEVTLLEDHSAAHLEIVDALVGAFEADRTGITAQVGDRALDELVAAHRLWSGWLRSGRVRKLAVVAEASIRPPATGG